VDIPATQHSGFGRSVAVGTLVAHGSPNVLVVDETGGNDYSTALDQNPVAQDDSAVGAINVTIPVNVLMNDSAGPGQSLAASSVTVAAPPQHGTATVSASDGSVTYQPANNYAGADSLQYLQRDMQEQIPLLIPSRTT
jgi:hypothetical protein